MLFVGLGPSGPSAHSGPIQTARHGLHVFAWSCAFVFALIMSTGSNAYVGRIYAASGKLHNLPKNMKVPWPSKTSQSSVQIYWTVTTKAGPVARSLKFSNLEICD